MKSKSENGIVTIPILVYGFIILGIVVGAIPFFNNTDHMFQAELQHTQAGYNAEAGIWLGLMDWGGKADTLPLNKTYSLPSGSVRVNAQTIEQNTIRIRSYGMSISGKDAIEATYNLLDKRFIHWHKIVQN